MKKIIASALAVLLFAGGLTLPVFATSSVSDRMLSEADRADICERVFFYLRKDAKLKGKSVDAPQGQFNCLEYSGAGSSLPVLPGASTGLKDVSTSDSLNVKKDRYNFPALKYNSSVLSANKLLENDFAAGYVPVCFGQAGLTFGSLSSGWSVMVESRYRKNADMDVPSKPNAWLNCANRNKAILAYSFDGTLEKADGTSFINGVNYGYLGVDGTSEARLKLRDFRDPWLSKNFTEAWDYKNSTTLTGNFPETNAFPFSKEIGGTRWPGIGWHTYRGDFLMTQVYNSETNTYQYHIELRNVPALYKQVLSGEYGKMNQLEKEAWGVKRSTYLASFSEKVLNQPYEKSNMDFFENLATNDNYTVGGGGGYDHDRRLRLFNDGKRLCSANGDFTSFGGSYRPAEGLYLAGLAAPAGFAIDSGYSCSWVLEEANVGSPIASVIFNRLSASGADPSVSQGDYFRQSSGGITLNTTSRGNLYGYGAAAFDVGVSKPSYGDISYRLYTSDLFASMDSGDVDLPKESETFWDISGFPTNYEKLWVNVENNVNDYSQKLDQSTQNNFYNQVLNLKNQIAVEEENCEISPGWDCGWRVFMAESRVNFVEFVAQPLELIKNELKTQGKRLTSTLGALSFGGAENDSNGWWGTFVTWLFNFSPLKVVQDFVDPMHDFIDNFAISRIEVGGLAVISVPVLAPQDIAFDPETRMIPDKGSSTGESACRAPLLKVTDGIFDGFAFSVCDFSSEEMDWQPFRKWLALITLTATAWWWIKKMVAMLMLQKQLPVPAVAPVGEGKKGDCK